MSESSLRADPPGRGYFLFGVFFLLAAGLMFYLVNESSKKWHDLHEHGTRVVAVVSEKHVIHQRTSKKSTPTTYHRLFFKPQEGLSGEPAALWAKTSTAKRYPNSESLFEDWGNRLWLDVTESGYESTAIGREFEMLIDGKDSLLYSPNTPPTGWSMCVWPGLFGVALLALGILRRRSFWRVQQERGQTTGTAGATVLLCSLLVTSQLPAQAQPPQQPPHIVFLLADDLGWTDLSTGSTSDGNGSPYHKTPNLDALAAAGASFTNAYSNGPNCAPSRAALWSGQWAARTGIYTVASGNRGKAKHRKLDAAANQTTLAPSAVTLAETLRAAGYTTAHFGKWHLGNARQGASPTDQGFDHQAGGDHRGGVGRIRNFADEQGAFPIPGLQANGKPRQFMADRLTDEALAWMAGVKQPLFCCISHYSVHTPIQAPDADIEATPPAEPGLRHKNRRYAAMLKNLDDNCGRVLKYLTETDDPLRPGQKLLANTLVVFSSDNGGLGGYRQAGIAGGTEVTNQLPLRAGKGSMFEGGTRVPFIARWDGKIVPGTIDRTELQLFDLYPTFAAVARASLPKQHAVDGIDVSGRFRRERASTAPRALFWHFPGYLEANGRNGTWRTTPAASMRRGDLKVVFWFETRTWSLFDLAADINEAHDLSASRPEDLKALAQELRDWLLRTKAPMPRTVGGGPVAPPAVPQ